MARDRLIDADATAGNTAEERVKRDRLVGPEKLDRSFGGAAGARRQTSRSRLFLCLPIDSESRAQGLGQVCRLGIPSLRGLKRVSTGLTMPRDQAFISSKVSAKCAC